MAIFEAESPTLNFSLLTQNRISGVLNMFKLNYQFGIYHFFCVVSTNETKMFQTAWFFKGSEFSGVTWIRFLDLMLNVTFICLHWVALVSTVDLNWQLTPLFHCSFLVTVREILFFLLKQQRYTKQVNLFFAHCWLVTQTQYTVPAIHISPGSRHFSAFLTTPFPHFLSKNELFVAGYPLVWYTLKQFFTSLSVKSGRCWPN